MYIMYLATQHEVTYYKLLLFSVVFDIHPLSSDDWIEFNCDRTGYYRVNYDTELWNRLAKQLNEDHTVDTAISFLEFASFTDSIEKSCRNLLYLFSYLFP